MRPYFEKMPPLGRELKDKSRSRMQASRVALEAVEAEIAAAKTARRNVGIPAEVINKRAEFLKLSREKLAPGGVIVTEVERTVLADHGVDLAGHDREVDVGQRLHARKGLGNAAHFQNGLHLSSRKWA